MKYKIYFPDENSCKWLDCLKKSYQENNGFCFAHKIRGKELGDNKQCSFYNKEGYCLIECDKEFNKRFYCDKHWKLLTEYDKQIKELQELNRRGKIIELVRILENYITKRKNIIPTYSN